MSRAPVAEIKRMAVHDGPGVRTTLFLKGCPLRCIWCHNPECIQSEPALLYRESHCSGCGNCVSRCPNGAQRMEDGRHVFIRERCCGCGRCVGGCFDGALELCGRIHTPEEAFAELQEDALFYRISGGGITLSGGEPLLYPEFCRELFALARAEAIHTALDTSAAVPWKAFETVLPETDLLLVDFKHPDPLRHKELTGLSNQPVKENLRRLQSWKIPIEIRIPLIPGRNDAPDDLRKSGEFLSELPCVTVVKLLPYHSFSRAKYLACGLPDTMPDVPTPSPEKLEEAADILRQFKAVEI